jgi:hypothetical protein
LFSVGTFDEKTFTDRAKRESWKLNHKALHASNHDLKIFDYGQFRVTPLSDRAVQTIWMRR